MFFETYDVTLLDQRQDIVCTEDYQREWINQWYKYKSLSFHVSGRGPIVTPSRLILEQQLMEAKRCIDAFHTFDPEKEKYYNQVTRLIDPFSYYRKIMSRKVSPARAMTNAWLKCWEMIHVFDLLPKRHVKVFCNAELPGAFLYAIDHYLQSQSTSYEWLANSLVGGSSDILGDEFGLVKRYPAQWLMNSEHNGDVTNPRVVHHIAERCGRTIDLYTSDIGIGLDYGTFDKQEEMEAVLQLGQLVCGLHTLRPGGNLICKQFMFFSPFSMSMIYLASQCFQEFSIFKPQTSRPANSEMYIIGKGYIPDVAQERLAILMRALETWNDYPVVERMKMYLVPMPEEAYLCLFRALYQIYRRQIRYIQRNIQTVSDLYPAPANIQQVRTHLFWKEEQERLRQWRMRFETKIGSATHTL